MSSYRQFQPSILPGYLQGPNGLAYAGVLGGMKDMISNDARAAAVVGMPNAQVPDALPAIAFERQLQRGAAETNAQFAERLRTAPEAWKLAGTPLSILLQMEIFYPTTPIAIVVQGGLSFTLQAPVAGGTVYDRLVVTAITGGWTFDGNGGLPNIDGFWSRFALVIYTPPSTWNDIVAPPSDTTAPTKNEVNDITRIVLKWKAAKATFMGTIVRTGGAIWGFPPSQDWGDPGLVWGGSSITYSPTIYT